MSFMRAIGLAETLSGFEQLREFAGDSPTWLVGTDTKYGVFLEFGTSRMEAYPWLRPAVEEFQANPARFVNRHSDTTVDEFESTDDVVRAIALALQNRAKDNVSADAQSDRSPGTHPDHPQVQTGNLRASIKAVEVG